jgi:hypothetical protein
LLKDGAAISTLGVDEEQAQTSTTTHAEDGFPGRLALPVVLINAVPGWTLHVGFLLERSMVTVQSDGKCQFSRSLQGGRDPPPFAGRASTEAALSEGRAFLSPGKRGDSAATPLPKP